MGFESRGGKGPSRRNRPVRSNRRRLLCESLEPRRLLSTNAALLVSQTVTANTVELPGAFFSETWTMKNTGTTTWTPGTSGYTLNLAGTDVLGVTSPTPDSNAGHYHPITVIDSGKSIAPGATATFTMSCIAPETPGTYTDYFQLNSPRAFTSGRK